ncbi:hypothetical protein J4H89_23205 (plasmid) [Ralstonia solanacearum]|nr:hypothetical protein J4H89_23205 [Ralstonia solanacearum]
MANTVSIDQIARGLNGLVPHWLPTYDLNVYAAKVEAECGYTADIMVAIEVDTKIFEEVAAFVHICGAFGRLHPSPARKYVCMRDEKTEIDDALARNAASACPTYSGLLTLLVDLGILGWRMGKEVDHEMVIDDTGVAPKRTQETQT